MYNYMYDFLFYRFTDGTYNLIEYDQLAAMHAKIEDFPHHQLFTPLSLSSQSPQSPLSQKERANTLIYETIM